MFDVDWRRLLERHPEARRALGALPGEKVRAAVTAIRLQVVNDERDWRPFTRDELEHAKSQGWD